MDSVRAKIILKAWLDSLEIILAKTILIQFLSLLELYWNCQKMKWNNQSSKNHRKAIGYGPYPWGNMPLFRGPAPFELNQQLSPTFNFNQFSGSDLHFQQPALPGPRMPYYPSSHRGMLPLPAARNGPSWRQPFYRSHPPRRRHHLDDIFLPNHDDDEYPAEEEDFHSRNSEIRPPVRVECKSTESEAIAKEKSILVTRNVNCASDKLNDDTERTVTFSDKKAKIKEIPECSQSSEKNKSCVTDGVKSIVKANASSMDLDVSKKIVQTINEKKNETKTNNGKNIFLQKNETASKEISINKTQVHIEKETKGICQTDEILRNNNAFGKKNMAKKFTNPSTNQTKLKTTKTFRKNESEKHIEKLSNDKFLIADKSENEILPTKQISNNRSADSDCKTRTQNVPNKNLPSAKKNSLQSKRNIDDKNINTSHSKNNIENKDKEKLQDKKCDADNKSRKKEANQTTDSTKDKTNNINENVQNKKDSKVINDQKEYQENVMKKDTINSNEKHCSSLEKDTVISPVGKNTSDSELDIVKELEALVNTPDNFSLTVNKHLKKQAEKETATNKCDHLAADSDKQITTLEEGNLTQDITSTSTPASPQTIKKDIRIKLIHSPLPKNPLALDKTSKNCDKIITSNTVPKNNNASNDDSCNNTSNNSKVIEIMGAKRTNKSNPDKMADKLCTINPSNLTDNLEISHDSNSAGTINMASSDKNNVAIIEDIFILEDALKNIDNPEEIIEVLSSPKEVESSVTLNTSKENVRDREIIEICSTPKRSAQTFSDSITGNSEDLQIIEEQPDIIEIEDDTDLDLVVKDNPVIPPVLIDVIKIESPDDCRRISRSPRNAEIEKTFEHERELGEFGSLDTRGSFLWTFHQRFDDPRVLDMDISHSPSSSEEPIRTEQQEVTDRVIKDMDALWKEISNSKSDESNATSETLALNQLSVTKHCNEGERSSSSSSKIESIDSGDQLDTEKITNDQIQNTETCKRKLTEKLTNKNFELMEEIIKKSSALSNCILQYSKNFTTSNSTSNIRRSASFSYKRNTSKIPLPRVKSLNDFESLNKNNFCVSKVSLIKHGLGDLKTSDDKNCTQAKTNKSDEDSFLNILISESDKSRIENSNISPLVGSKDELPTSNKEPTSGSTSQSSGRRYSLCKKSLMTDHKNASQNTQEIIKETKKKKVRRIDSSDEESEPKTQSTSKRNNEDQYKMKKERLKEKSSRKRKHSSDYNEKIKERKKDIGESTIANKIAPSAEIISSHGSTKYVTKSEYVKSFAKNKSPVPHISLSIEPFPKPNKITQRRATFTCETDNETILKKVATGDRCKQKFLDLFGSVSDDEEDLIQVSKSETCKSAFMKIEKIREKEQTQNAKNNTKELELKTDDTSKKRKRPYISQSFIEENSTASEASETSNKSKKYKMSCNESSDDRKKLKKRKNILERQISKERNTTLDESGITSDKLQQQKGNDQSKEKNLEKKANSKILNVNKRRESTSSNDSKLRDSSYREHRTEKKHVEKSRLKGAERFSRSRSKESDPSIVNFVEKQLTVSLLTNYKDAANSDLQQRKGKERCKERSADKSIKAKNSNERRGSSSSSNSTLQDNSDHEIQKKKSHLKTTHLKQLERSSKSRSKEFIANDVEKQTSTSVFKNFEKETISDKFHKQTNNKQYNEKGSVKSTNTNFNLERRRESTSSADSKSRDSCNQKIRKEKSDSEKDQLIQANSSLRDDSDHEIQKQKSHLDKTQLGQLERSSRSRSKESDSSTISDLEKQKRRSNFEEYKKEKAKKERSSSKSKYLISKDSLEHSEKSSSNSRRNSTSSNESSNSGHSHHKRQKMNSKLTKENLSKKINPSKDKRPSIENIKNAVTKPPNRDTFNQKVTDKGKSSTDELRPTGKKFKCSTDPMKKLKASFRRYSAPDALNNSSETPLIIDESFPLLCRASEVEIVENFDICPLYTPSVMKFDKITKIITVDIEYIDKVNASDLPEIYNDTKTIKQPCSSEDDDVIEIRPIIPMIDLTEEDTRNSHENSPKETLRELLLEAKKEIEGLGTITLYRSDENDNQDEEVQAVAASISLSSKNSLQVKKDKNLSHHQDATIASSSEIALEKMLSNNGERNDLEDNNKTKTPDSTTEAPEKRLPSTSQLFSTLIQNLEINTSTQEDSQVSNNALESMEHNNETVATEPRAIQEDLTSLVQENQRTVSPSVDNQQSNLQSETNTYLSGDAQPSLNKNPVTSNVDITRLNNENLNQLKESNATNLNTVQCQTTNHEPCEVPQVSSSGSSVKNKRPEIIVRPTRVEHNIEGSNSQHYLNLRLGQIQNRIIQEESHGQHRGLPQTLREYRPIRTVKVVNTVVPPVLVNINATQESQEPSQIISGQQEAYNNENHTTQNIVQNLGTQPTTENHFSSHNTSGTEEQSTIVNNQSVIDLTEDIAELSAIDKKFVVEIFTRHAYFLAHLCKAQNGYIEYLKQQPYCQNYFKAENTLFEEQKQARLISQSLRLVTELQHLNIRASKNLSGSASEIVEEVTLNLQKRIMPKPVTRSMVYLLIAQLIKPQAEMFARIPLLRALIRLCNIVVSRLYSKYPGPLTEAQRKMLIQQVTEYNRMFGQLSSPQNQLNSSRGLVQPYAHQSLPNPLDTEISQSGNQNNFPVPNNQTTLRNNHSGSSVGHTVLGDQQISQIGPCTVSPVNVRQPVVESINSSILERSQQFGLSQRALSKSSGGSVTVTRNLRTGPPNVTVWQNYRMQSGGSPATPQTTSSAMNPPAINQQRGVTNIIRPGAYVVPNNAYQTMGTPRTIGELPGGANTNTLGCTPRYIPNYTTPTQNNVYACIPRPRQYSLQNRKSAPRVINSLRNIPPPPRFTVQEPQSQNNLNRTNNMLPSGLTTASSCTNSRNPLPQQISVAQSPRHEHLEPNFVQSSERNVLSNGGSSFRQPPSYDETIANRLRSPSNLSSPNQLPPEEARTRNENLLKELLCTPDNEPVFARPSSPVNDNFRIKLPFTQPEQTPSATVLSSSSNTLSTFSNKGANSSLSTSQPIISVPKTTSPRSQTQNYETSVSVNVSEYNNIQTLTLDSDMVITVSQPNIRDNQEHLLPQLATSQTPIVLVNNTAASTRYIVGQPQKSIVLNQGLAALSSIGHASAMLNSSSQSNLQTQTNHSTTSVPNSSQTLSPVLLKENSNMLHPQSQNSINSTEVLVSNSNSMHISRSPKLALNHPKSTDSSLNNSTVTADKEKVTGQSSKFRFKVVSPKPIESKTKPKLKRKKKGRQTKQKKKALSRQIEIVNLLSSDEDMPLENQSDEGEPTSKELESNMIKPAEIEFQGKVSAVDARCIEQRMTDDQITELQQPCPSQASFEEQPSTVDTVSQDLPSSASETANNYIQIPNSESRSEDLQPPISKNPSRRESTVEEDDVQTIDLTWIDDMDDQELQREMDFVFIKKEESKDEEEQLQDRNNSVGEDDTTVYTVNVQKLCICCKTAQYRCICLEAWYCGQECQLNDWESHQNVCQGAMNTEEELTSNEQDVDVPEES